MSKKILALICAVCTLALAGCGCNKASDDVNEATEPTEAMEVIAENKMIDSTLIDLLGKEYVDVKKVLGHPTKATYFEGNIFYFGEDTMLGLEKEFDRYSSDGYSYYGDETFEEPSPFSCCTHVYPKLTDVVKNLDKESYSVEEFSEHIGLDIETTFSDYDYLYHHSFYYRGVCVCIYSESESEILSDSRCMIMKHYFDYETNYYDLTSRSDKDEEVNLADLSTEGIYTYQSLGDQCKIYSVDKNASGHITMPETIDGMYVTAIREDAFENCDNITSITMPTYVQEICDETFSGMENLKKINLPKSLRFIGQKAFKNCTALEMVDIPYGTTNIGTRAFENCTALKTVKIPSSVATLGTRTFEDCTNLENLYFGANLIFDCGEYLFSGCNNIKHIVLGGDASWLNYLSEHSYVMGDNFLTGSSTPETVLVLTKLYDQELDFENTHIADAKSIYYRYEDTGYFTDCAHATVYDNFNVENYPALNKFLDV